LRPTESTLDELVERVLASLVHRGVLGTRQGALAGR